MPPRSPSVAAVEAEPEACVVHPGSPASGTCARCAHPLCEGCLGSGAGGLCGVCAQLAEARRYDGTIRRLRKERWISQLTVAAAVAATFVAGPLVRVAGAVLAAIAAVSTANTRRWWIVVAAAVAELAVILGWAIATPFFSAAVIGAVIAALTLWRTFALSARMHRRQRAQRALLLAPEPAPRPVR